MLKGIDISSYQAGLDTGKVPSDFDIIKATEGVGYVSPVCDQQYQAAKKAGKLLGVYHFARNGANSSDAEANYFVSQIKGYIGQAILILDWEDATHDVAWAKRWLDKVYALTGVRPLIYMSSSVVNSYDWSSVAKANYGLWVAQYRDNVADYNYDMTNAGSLPDVKWWNGYAMWQWTSSGRLSGWSGNLDCSVFYGDKASWQKYAAKVTAPTPPPKPQPVITTKVITVTESLPYTSITTMDATLLTGLTKVTTKGVAGLRTIVYTVTYTDGKETTRTVKSDTITVKPINEVLAVGTMPAPSNKDKEQDQRLGVIEAFIAWLTALLEKIGIKR